MTMMMTTMMMGGMIVDSVAKDVSSFIDGALLYSPGKGRKDLDDDDDDDDDDE